MSTHIWLRAESKPGEERTALTPHGAGRLTDAGIRLTVEKSSQSAFSISEYEESGCQIADEHSWSTNAPRDAFILGLKELATEASPLIHRHIHFAHVYKNQSGWEKVLNRFVAGGGELYDLEFLVDDNGRRVAAFGHWAGFAGAALALIAWCNHYKNADTILPPVSSFESQHLLIDNVRQSFEGVDAVPKVLIIGSLGRAGRGAVEICESVGAETIKWDMEETSGGGPFEQILDADIFLNCVFVEKSIPPFLTRDMVERETRRLSVVSDISCDPYGDYNPIPIYEKCTTLAQPIDTIVVGSNPLYLIAIDHLPSIIPRESSEDFCEQLMPYLLQLNEPESGVWGRARELFLQKTSMIGAG